MNNQRRKKLRNIRTRIDDVVLELRSIAEEEEEYRDAIPENLQNSEKWEAADAAAQNINDAADRIESSLEQIEEACE